MASSRMCCIHGATPPWAKLWISQSSKTTRAPSMEPRAKTGHGHGEDHCGAAVAAFAALAAVGVDRQPDRLTREVVRVRLAVSRAAARAGRWSRRRCRRTERPAPAARLPAWASSPLRPRSPLPADAGWPRSAHGRRRTRDAGHGRCRETSLRDRWASTPSPPSRRSRAAPARSRPGSCRSNDPRRGRSRRAKPDGTLVLCRRARCDRATRSRHGRRSASEFRRARG